MPGAPNPNPGRQGVARLLLAAGQPAPRPSTSTSTLDADLLDLLDHAAAWHQALAGADAAVAPRRSSPRQLTALEAHSTCCRASRPSRTELSSRAGRALCQPGASPGTDAGRRGRPRRGGSRGRTDPPQAAAALLGGPAVVEGSLDALPADIATGLGDQARRPRSPAPGTLARWLQDSARVRPRGRGPGRTRSCSDDVAGTPAVGSLGGAVARDAVT